MTSNSWIRALSILPIFGSATMLLYTILLYAPRINGNEGAIKFPSTLEDIKHTAKVLESYYETHFLYVLLLFSAAYLYKQCFSIPGSALLNVLAGSLFGVWYGLPLCSTLTAIGATSNYYLSKLLLKEVVQQYFPTKLHEMQREVWSHRDNLPYYLLSLRLFPMSPNWLINIISPLVGIPVHTFFVTVLFGLIPYNFICTQSGSLLRNISSMGDIFTWTSICQMGALALVVLVFANRRKM